MTTKNQLERNIELARKSRESRPDWFKASSGSFSLESKATKQTSQSSAPKRAPIKT